MTKGLITRIGEWMDRKWAAKATWLDVQEQESRCSLRHCGALEAIVEVKEIGLKIDATLQQKIELVTKGLKENKDADKVFFDRNELQTKRINELEGRVKALISVVEEGGAAKELEKLKTRLEQLEIYTNMSRKVDPTKAAVAKSAFAM